MLHKRIKKFISYLLGYGRFEKNFDRQLLLLAQSQSKKNRVTRQVNDLGDVEFSVFSQWGEDGIIDWLISQIPNLPKSFVEFGVENYKESNTRLLLLLRNWQGLVIDGSLDNIQDIKQQEIYWKYSLTAKHAFIDRDNVNQLIESGGLTGQIGLLSVDIDGNDYWIWQAINCIKPAIVVIEYNAVFGDLHPLTVPYRADFIRSEAHYSNLYFGASLSSLVLLGKEKGYVFLGTSSTGANAFFIRTDLALPIVNNIRNIAAYPSLFREARGSNGDLLFISGEARSKVIYDLPLVNTVTNEKITLERIEKIYSNQWMMAGRSVF